MLNVVVIGEVCEDILMHYPQSVEVLGKKVWAEDIIVTAGGSATYVSAALAHLGVNVRVCATLGDDVTGKRTLEMLNKLKIDSSLVKVVAGLKTTASIVICDGPEKDFIGCSPMLPLHLPSIESVADADLIFISGYTMYEELWTDEAFNFFSEIKKRNIPIALDGQFLPIDDVEVLTFTNMDRLLPLVDVYFAARKETEQVVGTVDPELAGERLLNLNCKQSIIKLGEDGCMIVTENAKHKVGGHAVDAYDTVGSGDVFGGSYCYAILQGWDSVQSAKFANVFTALSIGKYETSKNFPTIDEVNRVISEIY